MTKSNFPTLNCLNQVAEFHNTFGHPILDQPVIPSKERTDLRVSLLQEELNELRYAIESDNFVEIADALCDIQYVLMGAVLEFGLGKKFLALFNEVHRSNMSKVCTSVKEVEDTMNYYKSINVETTFKESVNGASAIVYRLSDNKILKNINYSEADLAGILSE